MSTRPKGLTDEEWKERQREIGRKRRSDPAYKAAKAAYDRSPERRAKDRARNAKRRKDPAYVEKQRLYSAKCVAEGRYKYRGTALREWQERSWGRISLETMPHYAHGSVTANWLHKFHEMEGIPNVYHHDNDRMYQ